MTFCIWLLVTGIQSSPGYFQFTSDSFCISISWLIESMKWVHDGHNTSDNLHTAKTSIAMQSMVNKLAKPREQLLPLNKNRSVFIIPGMAGTCRLTTGIVIK